ncbi:hypothetical protein NKK48_01510 [Mesorhizobium sp. C386A]|uniref:hypothetical protein n=1 Tax=unclassified Mesorhizobium TaxID=325217 RepID=UPI0012EBC998|nr:hypothetical protein [Mesorhizobium sp. LNJC386A00]
MTDPDGNVFSVTLEVNEGKLVLQCNDPVHDVPLRVRMSSNGMIETDDERFGEQIVHHAEFQTPLKSAR